MAKSDRGCNLIIRGAELAEVNYQPAHSKDGKQIEARTIVRLMFHGGSLVQFLDGDHREKMPQPGTIVDVSIPAEIRGFDAKLQRGLVVKASS